MVEGRQDNAGQPTMFCRLQCSRTPLHFTSQPAMSCALIRPVHSTPTWPELTALRRLKTDWSTEWGKVETAGRHLTLHIVHWAKPSNAPCKWSATLALLL